MEKYTLSKPITIDGENITEIILDLESLSVADLERAERQARAMFKKKEFAAVIELNKKYQVCVAAIASGYTVSDLRTLNGKDYTQVCLLVSNFLLDGDSEGEELEELENEKARIHGKTPNSPSKTRTAQTLGE